MGLSSRYSGRRTDPSGNGRSRGRLCGLRRSPRPPAIGRGAYRPPRIRRAPTSCSSRPSATLPRRSSSTPSCSIMPLAHRAREAHRQQHQVRIQRELGARQSARTSAAAPRACRAAASRCRARRRVKFVVATLHSRMPPSSCELSSAQLHRPQRPWRHAARARSGGIGIISN